MDSDSRLAAYRKLIQQIKTVVKEKNLGNSDNVLIRKLLTVLQFDCEFKLLSECYSNSKEFNEVIPNMKTIYENYMRELEQLDKKKENNEFSYMDNFRYQRLSKATKRLDSIIQMVNNREFNHYIEAIVASLKESDEIIEVCGTILKDGIEDFSRLFNREIVSSDKEEHKIIDDDYIDTIYTLLSHSETIKLAENYLRTYRSHRLDELNKKKDTNVKYVNYLKIIQENISVFREYMGLIHYTGKNSQQELDAWKAKIASLELETQGTFNLLRRNSISEEISSLNEKISESTRKRTRAIEIEEEIRKLGCGDLIDALDTTLRDSENTPEAKIASMLRTLAKNSFNMSTLIKDVNNSIEEVDEKIKARQKALESRLDGIHNPVLKNALRNNPEDVQVLLKMRNPDYGATEDQKNIGVSPYLAALCLKTIKDAKHLTGEEIEQASEAYDKAGVFAKIEADNALVANCLSSINDLVYEVVNRVPYDPNDYGKISLS